MKIKSTKGKTIEEQYKKLGNELSGIASGIGALMLIGAVLCLVATVGQIIDKCSREDILVSLVSFYSLGLLGLVSMFIGKAFGKLKTLDSPFRSEIVEHLKKAGQLLEFGGVGGILMFVLLGLNSGNMNPNSAFITNSGSFFIMLLIGQVVRAVSLIFEYGCKLQQESDETL